MGIVSGRVVPAAPAKNGNGWRQWWRWRRRISLDSHSEQGKER